MHKLKMACFLFCVLHIVMSIFSVRCAYFSDNELMDQLRKVLTNNQHSELVKQGDSVAFWCGDQVKLMGGSGLKVFWRHNIHRIRRRDKRFYATTEQLIIYDIQPEDGGVYACMFSVYGIAFVAKVFALAVIPKKPNVVLAAGQLLELPCNGVYFPPLFGNMTQRWSHNNTLYKYYATVSQDLANTERLGNATFSDSGTYLCEVKNPFTMEFWKTNYVVVSVQPVKKVVTSVYMDILQQAFNVPEYQLLLRWSILLVIYLPGLGIVLLFR